MCLKELDEDALVIINVRVMLWHERSALGDMGGGRKVLHFILVFNTIILRSGVFLALLFSMLVRVWMWHFCE